MNRRQVFTGLAALPIAGAAIALGIQGDDLADLTWPGPDWIINENGYLVWVPAKTVGMHWMASSDKGATWHPYNFSEEG